MIIRTIIKLGKASGRLADINPPATVLTGRKMYEFGFPVFAALRELARKDGVAVTSLPASEALKSAEADVFVFPQAGDGPDPHAIEYIGCFFEDNPDIDAVFLPAVTPDGPIDPGFRNLPPGGVVYAAEKGLPPLSRCVGAARAEAVLAIPGESGLCEALPFAAAARAGRYGLLNAAKFSRESGYRVARHAEWAEVYRAADPPEPVLNEIRAYYEEKKNLPVDADGEGFGDLARLLASSGALIKAPAVRITEIENNYDKAAVSGYFYPGPSNAGFSVSGAEISVFERVLEVYEDLARERRRFELSANLIGNRAEINFPGEITSLEGVERNYEARAEGARILIEKIAARPRFRVSVIIPAYNAEAFLKDALESVVNQTLDFFTHIQTIIVNDGSEDGTLGICEEYAEKYPYNVVCVSQENAGVSAARNAGLRRAMGGYIMFLDADDTIDGGLLEAGCDYLDGQHNADAAFAAFPVRFRENGVYTPSADKRFETARKFDVEQTPESVQYSACGAVIRASAAEGAAFDENLAFAEDAAFIHDVLMKDARYGVLPEPFYNYRKSAGSATARKAENVRWYCAGAAFAAHIAAVSVEKRGTVSNYTRYLAAYQLIDAFSDKPAPENVDAKKIAEKAAAGLRRTGGAEVDRVEALAPWQKRAVKALIGDGGAAAPVEIFIDYMRETERGLKIAGRFNLEPLLREPDISAEFNGRRFEPELFENSRMHRFFLGRPALKACAFLFDIPVGADGGRLRFLADCRETAGFSFAHGGDFFAGARLAALKDGDALRVERADSGRREEILRSRAANGEAESIVNEYVFMSRLRLKPKIWLFADELDAASGPAARLYEYAAGTGGGADKFFVINKNSFDEYRLNEIGATVEFGSPAHGALIMLAEKIIFSNPRFALPAEFPFTGASGAEFIYIPKELITAKDADSLAPLSALPVTAVIASEEERAFLPEGLTQKAAVVLGSPRYADYAAEDMPRALFMPDYRPALYLGENKLNFELSVSDYCVKIGDLLLDDDILTTFEQNGVSLDFAPHERTMLQLGDFERDDSVTVIPPSRPRRLVYQNARLLITDSLSAYDFAYRMRPVIYWSFADAPAPEDGGRFGETVSDFGELSGLIREYTETGFKMPEKYASEVARFFKFRDGRDLERIYDYLSGGPPAENEE